MIEQSIVLGFGALLVVVMILGGAICCISAFMPEGGFGSLVVGLLLIGGGFSLVIYASMFLAKMALQ